MATLVWLRKFPTLDATTASVIVLLNAAAFFPSARRTSNALFLEGMALGVVGGIALTAGIRLTRASRRFKIGGRLLILGAILLATAVLIGLAWMS